VPVVAKSWPCARSTSIVLVCGTTGRYLPLVPEGASAKASRLCVSRCVPLVVLAAVLAFPSLAVARLPSLAQARALTLRALRNDVTLNVPDVTGESAFVFPEGMVPTVSGCSRARGAVVCTGAAYFLDPGQGLNYLNDPGWYHCTDRFVFSSSHGYVLKFRGCSDTQAAKWFTVGRAEELATQYGEWLVNDVGGSSLSSVTCAPIFAGDVFEHDCSYTFDFATSSVDQQLFGLGPTATCTQSIDFQLRYAYPTNGFEIIVETGNDCNNLGGGAVYEGPAGTVFTLEKRGGPIYDPNVP